MIRTKIRARECISIGSVAGYCMVSRGTVLRWIKNGKLKSIRLPSGQTRVSIEDFKEFCKQHNILLDNRFLLN